MPTQSIHFSSQDLLQFQQDHQPIQQKKIPHRLSSFFGIPDSRMIKISTTVRERLDLLENTYVTFNQKAQNNPFLEHLEEATRVREALNCLKSEKVKTELAQLDRRICALRYRLEASNGGWDKAVKNEGSIKDSLEKLALKWKEQEVLFEDKKLTEKDLTLLKEACHYKHFVPLIINDKSLREQFFNWVLRDNHQVSSFVEFPAHVEKIQNCYLLSQSLGTYDGKALQLSKRTLDDGRLVKDITLLCEGNPFTILDKSKKYQFKGNYELAFDQMLSIFHEDEFVVGNLSIFDDGIWNFNRAKWATWNAATRAYDKIDISGDDWIKKFRPVKTLSKDQVENRYKIKISDPQKWISSLRVTMKKLNLDIGDSHGYFEMAIPNNKGTYDIYAFGKYAQRFPRNLIENLQVLSRPVPSMIQMPDESFFRLERLQGGICCEITPERGKETLEKIRHSHLHPHKDPFQFLIRSCICWALKKFQFSTGHANLKYLLGIDFMALNPSEGALAKVFNIIKKVPRRLGEFIVLLILLPFGAWHELPAHRKNGQLKRISLKIKPIWQKGHELLHPAKLLLQQRQRTVDYSIPMK